MKILPPKGYQYIEELGFGQAKTWLGKSPDGAEVVIKTLALADVENWKGFELFEREIVILQQLNFPNIPNFVDAIQDNVDGKERWHIVQEKVDGILIEHLKREAINEKVLLSITQNVLDSLIYLQTFSPPILHRDVKPSNLIYNNEETFLVDFGSVRYITPNEMGGSTIAGTRGYMAPEQLMGRANTSSDLYGLGMTLVFLLTGKHPESLKDTSQLKINWKSEVHFYIHPTFRNFIDKLIEPISEDRFQSAIEARDALQTQAMQYSLIPNIVKPKDPTIFVAKYRRSIHPLLIIGLLFLNTMLCIAAFYLHPIALVVSLLFPFVGAYFLFYKKDKTMFRFDGDKVQTTLFKYGHENSEHLFSVYDFLHFEAQNEKLTRENALEVEGVMLTPKLSKIKKEQLVKKLEYLAKVEIKKIETTHNTTFNFMKLSANTTLKLSPLKKNIDAKKK